MPAIKKCEKCKFMVPEWYQNNTCRNSKAVKDLGLSWKNHCANSTWCTEVYEAQGLNNDQECKYFELGFWAKVAQIKYNICRKIQEFKMRTK